MPDQVAATADTGTTPDSANVTGGNAPTADTASAANTLLFGKYKTMEDAQRGWEEEKKLLDRQGSELGSLRAEVERLRRDAELKSLIEKVAETSSRREEKPQISMDEFMTEVATELVENPANALKKFAAATHVWTEEAVKKAKAEVDALKNEFVGYKKSREELDIKLTPEYQANKALVDKLVSDGMPIQGAIKWAKELSGGASTASAARPTTPPVISATRTTGGQPDIPAYMYSDKDLDLLRLDYPTLDDAGLRKKAAELNEARKERISRGEEIREVKRGYGR